MRPLTAILLVTVVGVAGVVGVPVTAAGAGSAQPSAQELWKAYPLQQGSATTGAAPSTPAGAGRGARGGAAAARAATRRPASGAAGSGRSGGWGTALALLAATLATLAAVGAVASRGRLRVAMRRALPRAPASAPRMLATGLRRAAAASPPPGAPEPSESDPAIADSPAPDAPEPFESDPTIADSPPPDVPEPFEGERESRPPRAVAARGRGRESRDGPGGEAAVPLPPDPSRRWIAEIAWTGAERPARFSLVAHDGEHEDAVVLAQSPPLPWPPGGAEEVAALTAAADDLTRAALSAGWSRAARGPAWYARRFAWRPAGEPAEPEPVLRATEPLEDAPAPPRDEAPPPDEASPPQAVAELPVTPGAASFSSPGPDTPTPPPHRFRRRPWPVEAELLWRCELRWRAGWMRSRLEAIAQPPLGGPRRPVAKSNPFTWMLHADPDPDDVEIRSAASDLRAMLLADGWSEIEPGRAWYAHRFLWRRDGEPPSHVDLGDGDDRRRLS